MTVPTDAPFIGWDWDIVQDANIDEALPPLYYNGAPINLTGCLVTVFIRPTYDHDEPLIILNSSTGGSGVAIDDAVRGLVTVYLIQTIVEALPVGEWRFFITVEDSSGNIAEVARGPFRIHAGNDSAP